MLYRIYSRSRMTTTVCCYWYGTDRWNGMTWYDRILLNRSRNRARTQKHIMEMRFRMDRYLWKGIRRIWMSLLIVQVVFKWCNLYPSVSLHQVRVLSNKAKYSSSCVRVLSFYFVFSNWRRFHEILNSSIGGWLFSQQ